MSERWSGQGVMPAVKRLIARAMRGRLSTLDALYQRHAGEECYLFGDGGSLRWMDLTRFADRLSILGPRGIYHREASALRVPYSTLTEPWHFYSIFPYRGNGRLELVRHQSHVEYMASIREHPDTLFFLNYSNYAATRSLRNVQYVSRWYVPPFVERNPFRERPDAHHGTLRFQLCLAIYMGFRRVYLVGHDYTHEQAHNRHFYEKWDGNLTRHPEYMREFLGYAQRFLDITTVTLEGGANVLPHVTYTELTGAEPHFRPNTEIVDRVKLESLATWFAYDIF